MGLFDFVPTLGEVFNYVVKCGQCNKVIEDGAIYYSHKKLGFVCEDCPAFSDGGVKAIRNGYE